LDGEVGLTDVGGASIPRKTRKIKTVGTTSTKKFEAQKPGQEPQVVARHVLVCDS